ncbi:GTPase activating protein [Novymonas esmeraldas]|uniref:GTPase activating protein n=1 Tax=Novymonas esmeraldas TaxID=1808958 RepID=A0AAW0EKV1_9TRYP
MYTAFLERILGYPASTAGEEVGTATAPAAGGGGVGGAGTAGSSSSSSLYKAATRPYRCSQGHLGGRPGSGDARSGDGDSASRRALSKVGGSSPTMPTQPAASTGASASRRDRPAAPTTPRTAASASPPGLGTPASRGSSFSTAAAGAAVSGEHVKRFEAALRADPVDVAQLRELSWLGCPVALRYEAWMFLTGCWTAQSATRQPTVSRRRIEYAAYIHSSYGIVDWDAVCAMVDSGVDTAVRRSTLKSLEIPPGATQVSGTPRDTSLTEFMSAAPGASQTLLRAASLATGGGGGGGGGVPLPRRPPHGLPRAGGSLDDVRSAVQPCARSGSAAPSPLPPTDAGTLESSLTSFSVAPSAAAVHLATPTAWAATVGESPSQQPQRASAAPPRLCSASLTLPASITGVASSVAGVGTGTAMGHQLSVSTMLGTKELQTLKQIRKDIPRMSGGHCYLRHPRVQGSIERVLFIWSLRHPACGYVQGMNDLVVPFAGVVLGHRFCPTCSITELHSYTEDILEELWSVSAVPVTQWINEVEADVYWMTSYLLNTMQDNYTSRHAGITAMMRHLATVVQAADAPLYHHLVDVMQLNFEQFPFRWMNCLLMRELTETQSLRLLDAYLSDEERRWSVTHVYVCAALLLRWGPQLMSFGEDYIAAMKFLQTPPTERLSFRDMQDVLSEGFVLQSLYEASLARLTTAVE